MSEQKDRLGSRDERPFAHLMEAAKDAQRRPEKARSDDQRMPAPARTEAKVLESGIEPGRVAPNETERAAPLALADSSRPQNKSMEAPSGLNLMLGNPDTLAAPDILTAKGPGRDQIIAEALPDPLRQPLISSPNPETQIIAAELGGMADEGGPILAASLVMPAAQPSGEIPLIEGPSADLPRQGMASDLVPAPVPMPAALSPVPAPLFQGLSQAVVINGAATAIPVQAIPAQPGPMQPLPVLPNGAAALPLAPAPAAPVIADGTIINPTAAASKGSSAGALAASLDVPPSPPSPALPPSPKGFSAVAASASFIPGGIGEAGFPSSSFSAFSGGGAFSSGAAPGGLASAALPAAPAIANQIIAQLNGSARHSLLQGQSHMRISLHPSELGQVDVRLTMRDGRMTAHLLVDRPETLELLQSQSRHLEKALADPAARADDRSETKLELSLRNDRGNDRGHDRGGQFGGYLGGSGGDHPDRSDRAAATTIAGALAPSDLEATSNENKAAPLLWGRRDGHVDVKL
ncbi:flagellar hook-length control protein FliK [Iodidimonas sp. MBR-55]|uniref:flagellar hook-length control protein FliK n=2 Tax=Iodidimonas TaxID=2066486 RepID=UPI00248285AF|nr:flagellar hook-length control protein FliK [Iodidimonas sp. MBR-55]